jgi:WD40 repeat protein
VSVRAIGDIERGQTRWPYRDSARRLADALGLEGQERDGFVGLARRPVAGTAEAEPAIVPYRGLSAFGERDAGLFFGREEAASRVLELMSARLDRPGLLVVSGVSGVGKSSLLRAGVLPRLRDAGLAAAPEAAAWPSLAITPGHDPVAELAVRIAPLARTDASALRRQLAADPAGFSLTARQAALAGPAGAGVPGARQPRVVLVADQCEQIFTACESRDERQAFVTALHAAATGRQPAALVVLVVRADFEARLADFPQLAAAVQDRYLLTAMTRRQLRLAITQPAAAAGGRVDEDLVQVLLEEAGARADGPPAAGGSGAGVLPLLSHALDQAWRTRDGQGLTLGDYDRAGGIERAVAASAQRAYQGLTPAQQVAARHVFTRLTATGADGTETAVPAAQADLMAGAGEAGGAGQAQAKDVAAVLERFAAQRLLTLDSGTVEMSHEVLLTAWPLLRDDWLADARADRIIRTRLQATATEWVNSSRDPSYLYSGSRLDAAAGAAARMEADPRQVRLSRAENDFLHASQRAARRRIWIRRQLTAVLLALVVALTTGWVVAVRAGQAASAARDIAVSRLLISQSEVLADTDPTASRANALAAWAASPSPQSRYAMLSAAANPQAAVISADPVGGVSVAFSPDGKALATGGPDGVRLWDVATGYQAGRALAVGDPANSIESVAFSPDGTTLATAGPDGVQLWNVATGRRIGRPFDTSAHEGGLAASMAFSPNGTTLATGGMLGARLWDVATGRPAGPLLSAGPGGAYGEAFSPNGKTLATSGPAGARLWNVATGRPAGPLLNAGPGGAYAVAFSPNGKTLATGGPSGARLWDPGTGRPIGNRLASPSGEPVESVNSVAFSPDSAMLATDGPRLWDVATGRQVGGPLTNGDVDTTISLAFSPDGAMLAAGGPDGTARLWDVSAMAFRPLGSRPADRSGYVAKVAFSPDGVTLATSTLDGTTQLWDVTSGHPIGPVLHAALAFQAPSSPLPPLTFSPDATILATSTTSGAQLWNIRTSQEAGKPFAAADAIRALAFSPDGKTLAAVEDSMVQLWDVASGQLIGHPLFASTCALDSCQAAFSPDGTTLALGSPLGVRLWDVSTGRPISKSLLASTPLGGTIAVAFSPDGATLATSSPSGARLWDVATGQQVGRPLTDPNGDPANSVAFSPDSTTLATGSLSGARLWDVATGQQIGRPLADAIDDMVNSVAFSPDGTTLATGDSSGVQLWDVSYLTGARARLCAQTGDFLTPAEWARYLPPGTPHHGACLG